MRLALPTLIAAAGLTSPVLSAEPVRPPFLQHSSMALKVRTVHFDRDFENDDRDLRQTAVGIEVNADSGPLGGIASLGGSLYQVQKLAAAGYRQSEFFPLDNGGDFDPTLSQLGQFYLDLRFKKYLNMRLGRQQVKTMMLDSSRSRAVPSTFHGLNLNARLANVELYGVWVDQWSPRHDDNFVPFSTDNSPTGAIEYIGVVGAIFQHGNFRAQLEQVTSKDYLTKQGLILQYQFGPDLNHWELGAGYLNSRDAGDLFIEGAERGDVDSGTDDNHSQVYFASLGWASERLSLGMAISLIRDDVWIEDLYAGDHGANPLATRAPTGQDLTGKNADVWHLRAGYDWSPHVSGLTTLLLHSRSNGAENTYHKSLGSADEWYTALDVRWVIPAVQGLSFRWLSVDYHSNERGSVAMAKPDAFENRLYLDYVYLF